MASSCLFWFLSVNARRRSASSADSNGNTPAKLHAEGVIMCSRCDSRKDNYYGECEQFPPEPTPCPKKRESMFCSIVREIDFEGFQLLFARDCARTFSDERCIVQNMTNGSTFRLKNVCSRTCATSGCNSQSLSPRGASSHLNPPSSQISLLFGFLFITVYINSCLSISNILNKLIENINNKENKNTSV